MERWPGQPKAYEERQDVLGLALDLHMWVTGSGPDLSMRDCEHAIRHLRLRLGNWSSNGDRAAAFDSAVRTVLTIALLEAEAHRDRWGLAEKEGTL